MSANDPYTEFADAYFAGDERRFSEQMAEFALVCAARYSGTPPRRAADLACGIGAACVVFARNGLDVLGTDRSATMIRNARGHAEAAGQSVRFLVQDYRDFRPDEAFDLITCMYDSLNFVAVESELCEIFKSVRRALASNGLFVFDIYTIRGLAEYWGSRAEVHTATADYFVVSTTTWSHETCSNTKTLDGFSRTAEGGWRRWQERHVMFARPLARINQLLAESGLRIHASVDWEHVERPPVTDQTQRAVFVAGPV